MTKFNTWFRQIRLSHRMDRRDIVACCALGGLEISASRAESWMRGVQGGALDRGARRSTAMTEPEFTAFVAGLPDWSRQAYSDDPSQ